MPRTPEPRIHGYLHTLSRTMAALVALIGALGLLGWAFDSAALKSVVPGRPPIMPNTACGLLLAGAALALLEPESVSSPRRTLARVVAAVLVVLGVLTLGEYVLDLDLGLDQLVLPVGGAVPGAVPGRPSPPTAVAFVLFGGAFLSFDANLGFRRAPTEILSLAGGLVALIGSIAHAYGAENLYRIGRHPATGMAISTVLAFLILCIGVLCARPGGGIMSLLIADAPGGTMARRLSPAVILAMPLLGWLALLGHQAGVYDLLSALALFGGMSVACAIAMVLLVAAPLNRAETARRRIEEELAQAREAERRLHAQLEAVDRATSAVTESVLQLPEAGMKAVLQMIVTQAQAVTGAEYAALGTGGDPEHPFDQWAYSGMTPEHARAIGRAPRPIGLLSTQSRRPLRVRDVRADPRSVGCPAHHPIMKSFLGVPIPYEGRIVGNLYLCNKRDAEEFSEEDERMVGLLATRVGVALETARLYRSELVEHAWLQSVIDQMPEGVILCDEKGHVLTYNRAALALSCGETGRIDPFGNPLIFDVRRPSGATAAFDELPIVQALTRGETTAGAEFVVHTKDGRAVPVLMSASPVRGRWPAAPGVVSVLKDISDLKELERLREEWSAIVAHDLRQPIGVIILAAEVLARSRKGDLTTVEAKALDRIRGSAQRQSAMVGDLLDASRIESRQLQIERQPVDLPALVHEVVERSASLLSGHPVRIEVRGPAQTIAADPGRLEQVLTNLLSNAAKYGTPGTEIVVHVEQRSGEVEVSVANHGYGLTDDERAHLFARFYRAKRTGGPKGIGLGLYISKGLVEAHGGRIWVETLPRGMTTFRFLLPLSASEHLRQSA